MDVDPLKYEHTAGWLRNPNHQLIGGKHPSIYRVSTIQGDAGFLPSTICFDPFIPIPILTYTHLALLHGFASVHNHAPRNS